MAYQVFLVSVSVSLATLAESRLVRSLLHFVLLGVLLQGLSFGITGAVLIGEFSQKVTSTAAFWLTSLSVLFGMVTTGLLLFESAAARLSLATEDYARGARLVYVAQFLGAGLLFIAGWKLSGESEVLTAGCVTLSVYATLVGLFVASDRDGMARVHWATGKRYWLLKPGGLRGYVLVVVLLLLMAVSFVTIALSEASLPMGAMLVLVAAPAFALLMLSLPVVVARWIPHPPWQTPAMIRLVFLGLVVLMTGVPPLIGEIVSEADDLFLNALNPIVGLINIEKQAHDAAPLVLLIWGIGVGLAVSAFFSLRSRDTEWLA